MQVHILKPHEAISDAYRRLPVTRTDMERFKAALVHLLDRINTEESEENCKNLVRDFLLQAWYRGSHEVNTKGRTDLVIHHGPEAQSEVAVILEAKRPTNRAEMPTEATPNTKALHELLLYYFREREAGNLRVKHLVATNGFEWHLLDERQWDKRFYRNKALLKQYREWAADNRDTAWFYANIARPAMAANLDGMDWVYVDIRAYESVLRNASKSDDVKLINLYKLLSPSHLLRQPFANDSNSLAQPFYAELLHLIGLEEVRDKGRKLIQRKAAGQRHTASLLENTIAILESEDRLANVAMPEAYGDTREEQLYEVALELCITWVNRVLFLKLVEAQLLRYHKGDPDYRFLDTALIGHYDALNRLFFRVLAMEPHLRAEDLQKRYRHVPYLNSSLFEPTALEQQTLTISNLDDGPHLPLMPGTILAGPDGKRLKGKLPTLHYLLRFLDAFDFSSEGSEAIQEENKTLINAAVLGLIFEKINGYRDGAFFTPAFITMHMARDVLREAVTERFNRDMGIGADTFEELANYTTRQLKPDELLRMNEVVNGIRICDTAVGSGHFLVSCLNELIAIKSELGILCDSTGNRLHIYATVESDELNIKFLDGSFFEYYPENSKLEHIQRHLFHEKQTLIENCLFGVDINPNSAHICRLRLWIELLKHAYYKYTLSPEGISSPSGGGRVGALETLPNIDINIKTGNSLVGRFAMDEAGTRDLLPKDRNFLRKLMVQYSLVVQGYKQASDRGAKAEYRRQISYIKTEFEKFASPRDPEYLHLKKLKDELGARQFALHFEEGDHEQWQAESDALEVAVRDADATYSEKLRTLYRQAFEWRFEFPEVLDEDARFTGFDIIIGNPPYIRQEQFSAWKPYLKHRYEVYAGTADLLTYFIELGMKLLRPGGHFTFIVSNKFMRAGYGKALRQWMLQHRLRWVIDFGDLPVFQEATTYPCILAMQKEAPPEGHTLMAANVDRIDLDGLHHYLKDKAFPMAQTDLDPTGWVLSGQEVQSLLHKLRSKGVPLGEYVKGKIYRGVLTGLNEAFVVDEATKERLIAEHPSSAELLKPFLAGRDIKRYRQPVANKWLIMVPKGFTIKRNLGILPPDALYEPEPRYGNMPYDDAWDWFRTRYPAIARHLLPFKARAQARADQGDFWWELRACDYYEEFEKPKILLPDISLRGNFTIDAKGGLYLANTGYIICSDQLWLLAILNSSTVDFFYRSIASSYRGGYLRFIYQYLSQIPIVEPSEELKKQLNNLVQSIIDLHSENPQADTTMLDKEIDEHVNELYG